MDGFSKRDFESKSSKIIKVIIVIIIIIISIFLLYKIDIIQKLKSFENKITTSDIKEKEEVKEEKENTNKLDKKEEKKNTTSKETSKTKEKKIEANKTTKTTSKETNKSSNQNTTNKKSTLTCTKKETTEDDLDIDIKFVFTFENDKLLLSKHDETIVSEDDQSLLIYFIALKELADEFNGNIRNGSYTKVLTDDKKITFNQVIDYKTIDTEFLKNQEYIDLPFTKETTKTEVLSYMKKEGCSCK